MDQVYLTQRKEYIERLNKEVDFVFLFSNFWEKCALDQGLKVPTGVIEHGFQPDMHYPIPKKLARMYLKLDEKDFIIVNSNRNQPRKRLDLMIMAFAKFISKHMGEPIKLYVGTSPNGSWFLLEIFEVELRQYGISLADGMKHVMFTESPQNLTDFDINVLYNAADVGINTCMGEGWGMCNFEGGGVGVPQIVPAIGGFLDFFDEDTSIMIEPKIRLYTDMTIDGCPGCAQIGDYKDFANALETYYTNRELLKKHGEEARKSILKNYEWDMIGNKFYNYIKDILKDKQRTSIDSVGSDKNIESSKKIVDKGKINSIDELEFDELIKLREKINQQLQKKI